MTIECLAYVPQKCSNMVTNATDSTTIDHRLPFAFLISPLERVVRSDGTRILVTEPLSSKEELKRIKTTITSKLILLAALWAVWSFFYR